MRIIVASATLDAQFFKDFFEQNLTDDATQDRATIIHLEGRTFPVDIFYLKTPTPDYMRETMDTVLKIHRKNEPGDVLCFDAVFLGSSGILLKVWSQKLFFERYFSYHVKI